MMAYSNDDQIINSNWLTEVAGKEEFWIPDISGWPSIISYEYRNLRNICRANNPYGVLICLKDNFETIIKLETLLAFAWAEQNTDEDFCMETISLVTTPNLSLGAWIELARILIKNLKRKEIMLPTGLPLGQLYKSYDRLNIVSWRNNKLGHGAMELEDDEDFREDIVEKITELKELCESFSSFLKGQKLYSDGLQLNGPDLARGLGVSGKITCELSGEGVSFSADPYIIIRKHEKYGRGVYFFDNQKTKTLTEFQAYAVGDRARETVAHFERLRRNLEQKGIDRSARPDEIILAEAENRELDLLQMSHGFVNPEHLTKWLQDCINKHESGVFLLQMDRGLGKSVFSEKLDRMYEKPLNIDDDLDVRTYHFFRMQSAGYDDVKYHIEWQWANAYKGGVSWERHPRISDYERDGLSSAEALCKFLKETRRYTQRNRHKEKIMMVFDGLDEIIEDGIWSMMPSPDMLSEGIYILMTCRNPVDGGTDSSLSNRLNSLMTDEHLAITKDSNNNIQFLRSYVRCTGLKGLNEEDISYLIKQSGCRVLYLGMMCRLIECGIEIADIPDAGSIVEKYLATLDKCYGEKASIRIREILAVITTLGMMEPLLLEHIGGLSAEGQLTIGLIGMIRDLAPMLRVSRSAEGNLYSIANPDLASELFKQLPETEDTIRDMLSLGVNQIRGSYPPELPETIPVIAHICELALMLDDHMSDLDDDFYTIMREFISAVDDKKKYIAERNREIEYREQLVLYCNTIAGEEHPNSLREMNNLAAAYREIGNFKKAETLNNMVLDIGKKVHGEEHPEMLTSWANLAVCYDDMGQHEKAALINEHILKLRIKMLGEEHPDTIVSMNNLALCYRSLAQYEKATALNEKTLDLCGHILGAEHPLTLKVVSNLALCYDDMGQHEQAVFLQESVLKLYTKKFGEEHPDTLTVMNNLASSYNSLDEYEKAVELYEKVLESSKKVRGEEHPDTINAMGNLASCYDSIGSYEKAIELSEKVLKLNRKVLGTEHPQTITAMGNLAFYKTENGQYETAIELYEKLLELNGLLSDDDKLLYMSNLAACYDENGQYEKAIEVYEKVLELSRRLLSEEHPDTVICMLSLALCYRENEQYKKAAELYEKVLELNNDLPEEEQLDTLILINSAAYCYFADEQYEKAVRLYEKELELSKAELGDDHDDTLLCMDNLVACYRNMGKYAKAIKLESKVRKLRGV